MSTNPLQRYLTTDYLTKNPTWDVEDSPWKAALVASLLSRHGIEPRNITDIGCGAGAVLRELRHRLPNTELTGFDIAPDASRFWATPGDSNNIRYFAGDFLKFGNKPHDVVLMLDVLEHLQDPFDFLSRLRGRADWYVFHFPLDLSALNVVREIPLLRQRVQVGHIHYYTRGLALAMLEEAGFKVVEASYTGAGFSAPVRGLRTYLARLPRRLARLALGQDLSIRLLGGETLLVLARDG